MNLFSFSFSLITSVRVLKQTITTPKIKKLSLHDLETEQIVITLQIVVVDYVVAPAGQNPRCHGHFGHCLLCSCLLCINFNADLNLTIGIGLDIWCHLKTALGLAGLSFLVLVFALGFPCRSSAIVSFCFRLISSDR